MKNPNISEFIKHPDYQQIASFFLGAVFITSLNYSFRWIRGFLPRFMQWISRSNRPVTNDEENNISEKASITSSSNGLHTQNHSLVFALSICFAFTSVAYFGSLLSFNLNEDAACAFLVAWGGMAAQTATIVGLLILILELKDLGIAKMEYYSALACLLIAMVLVFVNNAIGTGTLNPLNPKIALCYKQHILATALATSLISVLLDCYVLIRLVVLLTRQTTLASQRLTALRDGRIAMVLSLLLLELLIIGPSAIRISLIADFIPLSIGALFVLVAFNSFSTSGRVVPVFYPSAPPPISALDNHNPVRRSGWFSGSRSFSNQIDVEERPRASPLAIPRNISHPFSAQYQREISRFSFADTVSTQDGVIQTVQRSAAPSTARPVIVTPTEAQLMSTVSTETPQDVFSVAATANTSPTVELQAPTPEASPSLTPTSLLMHPWHEKRRREDSTDQRSIASTIRPAERLSYTYQGFAFPVPPIPSPTPNATRRYTSSTLASPISSKGEIDGEQKKVRLLTFASTFRNQSRGGEKARA